MNNKCAAVWTAVVVVILCVFGFGIYHCYLYAGPIKTWGYSDYEKALYNTTPPYTREDIENSNAAYLLDPNFQITPENFPQVMQDYFSAPSRLFIFATSQIFRERSLKSDKIDVNAEIGKVFAEKVITMNGYPDSIDSASSGAVYEFSNDIGDIWINCFSDKTYIKIVHFPFSEYKIVIDDDIEIEMNTAITEVLPYTMYDGD